MGNRWPLLRRLVVTLPWQSAPFRPDASAFIGIYIQGQRITAGVDYLNVAWPFLFRLALVKTFVARCHVASPIVGCGRWGGYETLANPLYTRLQGTADRMLGKFGNPGKIIDTSAPLAPVDPVEGGDPTYPDYDCSVVIMAYDQRYVNGTTILAGDVQLYISAIGLTVEPQVGKLVSAGGKTYLIVNMDPNRFDGQTPVVYVAQARSAS